MGIRRAFIIAAVALLPGFAAAQERVSVGALRLTSNGALFLAAGQDYFKAEGLDVDLKFYSAAQPVAAALAAGEIDFGATAFTAALFNLAGKGAIKMIAGQAREKRDYEGNDLVASNAAYAKGLRKFEDLPTYSLGITQLGSSFHYQAGQIARVKGFAVGNVTLKPMQTFEAIAAAIAAGSVDAAILPAQIARDLLLGNQARLIGWYSEIDEQQLGALFASSKTLQTRRAVAEKFVRAYRRGAADFAVLLRRDRYAKRVSDAKSQAAAAIIARYVDPQRPPERAAAAVEASVYFIDPQARIDVADLDRQIAWYKAQGLVEAGVESRMLIDPRFDYP